MDESYFKERISGYFDNNLPPDEHQLVEDFLQNSEEGRRMLDELGRLDEFVARHSKLSGSDDIWEARASKIEAALGFLEEPEPVVTDIARPGWSWWGWKGAALAASAALLVFIGINQTDIFDSDQIAVPVPLPAATPQAESGDVIIDIDGADYQPSTTTTGQDTTISVRKKIESPKAGIPKPVADEDIPAVSRELVPPPPAPARTGSVVIQTAKVPSITPPVDKDKAEAIAEDEPAGMDDLAEEAKTKVSSLDLGSTKPEPEPASAPTRGAARAIVDFNSTETVEGTGDLSQSIEVAAEPVEQRPLAYWSERRDSLETALKSSNNGGIAPKAHDLLKSGLVSQDKESGPSRADQTEAALVEALYNVARLSEDEAEKKAAIERLEAIAGNSKSSNQTIARQNLDILKQP